MDLTVIWAGIIVFAYVALDGFDLGIGILFPSLPAGLERDQAMNAIAPVWDGNETWLVMGGGGLFAAFPLAYAILLPATYPPIIAMLLGLVLSINSTRKIRKKIDAWAAYRLRVDANKKAREEARIEAERAADQAWWLAEEGDVIADAFSEAA